LATRPSVPPDDARYTALVGRRVRIPFVERDVPIISDDVVDPAFGTGAVKITPAHDADDYATGRRHGLPMIQVLAEDGTVNEQGAAYAGLDRYEARTAILRDLEVRGDLAGAVPHEMLIGRCERSGDVIEPLPKTQWFIRTGPLAEAALAATRSGRLGTTTWATPRRVATTRASATSSACAGGYGSTVTQHAGGDPAAHNARRICRESWPPLSGRTTGPVVAFSLRSTLSANMAAKRSMASSRVASDGAGRVQPERTSRKPSFHSSVPPGGKARMWRNGVSSPTKKPTRRKTASADSSRSRAVPVRRSSPMFGEIRMVLRSAA
jgi:hypothetical protein